MRKSGLAILRSELIEGRSTFDWVFLLLGLSIQVLVFVFTPMSALSLVSGIAGIFSVILCSQGKISTFAFGLVQITTYLYLSLVEHLYAEVAINVFYFFSQFYGFYVWRRRYSSGSDEVPVLQTRSLRPAVFAALLAASLALSALVGWLLAAYTDDSQPFLDAFTTVPAIVAQILMTLAYRQQWYIWLIIDVLAVVLWLRAGNYCLAAQYAFWCANCIYGLTNWSKYNTK